MYTNEVELLQKLREGDNSAFKLVYKMAFKPISVFILKNSGTIDHAKDLFHDAIAILIERLSDKDFLLTCSYTTFLFSICKNLWLKELNLRKRDLIVHEEFGKIESVGVEKKVAEEEIINLFEEFFHQLSLDCQKIIRFHLNNVDTNRLMEIMEFSSLRYTMTRRYKCMNILIGMIQETTIYKTIIHGLY